MLTEEQAKTLAQVIVNKLQPLPAEDQSTVLAAFLVQTGITSQIPENVPKVKVLGGRFDGQLSDVLSVHRIVGVPREEITFQGALPQLRLIHYELLYQCRGEVTKEEAERILGRPLE